MKKFSQILENINNQQYFEISAEIKLAVNASSEGEAGYLADSILGGIEEQIDFSVQNIGEISKDEFHKYFENAQIDDEDSGHRDSDGNWITEPWIEKVRNRLTGFWTLSTLLMDVDIRERLFTDPKIQKMMFDIAELCEKNKPLIQKYLGELSNIETESRKKNNI